jgi:hypothetical protein
MKVSQFQHVCDYGATEHCSVGRSMNALVLYWRVGHDLNHENQVAFT